VHFGYFEYDSTFLTGIHASLAFTLHLEDFTASHNASVAFLRWFVRLSCAPPCWNKLSSLSNLKQITKLLN